MCYRGCIHEDYFGECMKKKSQHCPEDYEEPEDEDNALEDYELLCKLCHNLEHISNRGR